MRKLFMLGLGIVPLILLMQSCGSKPQHNANWYYYWEKDGVVPYLNRVGSPVSRWAWDVPPDSDGSFLMGAAHGPSDGFVLTDFCIMHPAQSCITVHHKINPTISYCIGATTTYGIQQVAATASHERQHVLNWKEINAGNMDVDCDGLADLYEGPNSQYQFIIGDKDTYNLAYYVHPAYADYGENEFVARQDEISGVSDVNLDMDWSVGGAQW